MKRPQVAALLVLIVVLPAAAAGSFFASRSKPCFIAGNIGYRISDKSSADLAVRIDNAAAKPDLRMQLVDDSSAADFVLVDDATAVNSCAGVATVKSVRLDAKAQKPDLTVTLSRAPAAYKIYVRSAEFSQADAAALFAAIWQNARKDARQLGSGHEFAARD
jgi:hypothetical protein